MAKLKLTGTLFLNIEEEKDQLRMFITDGAEELVCHKLSLKELNTFLQSDTAHLFKGRLQLDKNNEAIVISVKNKDVGVVKADDILRMIQLPV